MLVSMLVSMNNAEAIAPRTHPDVRASYPHSAHAFSPRVILAQAAGSLLQPNAGGALE
jgi:hypothetical protein